MLIFKRQIGECPEYMEDLLVRNADNNGRAGRYSNIDLICPRYIRESDGGKTFQVQGSRLWNSIPIVIRKKDSINSFKYALRKHFLTIN